MATALSTVLNDQVQGFTKLPAQQQVGIMVAAAAVVALVITLFIWITRPTYAPLYSNLSEHDAAQVAEALGRNGVNYRLDRETGAIMVPENAIHEARLQMAAEGLPKTPGFGFEILERDQGLGTSRMVETARYHHALEGELARTISTISSVESARVHLALPRDSVFVRERTKASASVVVTLLSGRSLNEQQVTGIVNLVASSIATLDPENVTVVDQHGRLLTVRDDRDEMSLRADHLEYTQRVEEGFERRIVQILSPLVGLDGVRAQVTADLDFSRIERTQEAYDPQFSALRSEQISEEETRGMIGIMGVPGALVNQPPPGGAIAQGEGVEGQPEPELPSSMSRRSTRNFEVDRTISHIREAPGSLRRLSVAVVVDHRQVANAEGVLVREAWPAEEMERINALVRDAVGFDARRGDSVNVINASFRPAPVEMIAEQPWWREPWIQELAKTALGALLILILILAVLRPLLRTLADKGAAEREALEQMALEDQMEDDQLTLGHDGEHAQGQLESPDKKGQSFEDNLELVRNLVREDPKRVAQVIKVWIATDAA